MKEPKQRKGPKKLTSTTLTTNEVARIFGVHASTIRHWSQQGKLRHYQTGPRAEYRFRREDVAVLYLDRAIKRYLKDKSA